MLKVLIVYAVAFFGITMTLSFVLLDLPGIVVKKMKHFASKKPAATKAATQTA